MEFYVYCDESRQDLVAKKTSIKESNEYSCFGGVMLPSEKVFYVKNKIKELKNKYSVFGELKWSNVSMNKIDFYEELVDLFFSCSFMSFRTVVVDAKKLNNNLYNNGDQELGYYKFYYQLLNNWIDVNNQYRIYTDQKTNKDKKRIQELKRIVNKSNYGAINSIQSIDSKESLILQMQNIIMGAVGYKYNYSNSGKSVAKKRIINKIEHYICQEIKATGRYESKFNVFEIRLRED